jgi:hypothetical protein
MTWTRRRFLAWSATVCAGAAIAGDSVARLLSGATRERVRLLTSSGDGVPSAAFERAVRAALGGTGVDVDAVVIPVRPDLARWREVAASVRGGVMLGVVSASEFVLVNELIREAGARLLYLGEHTDDAAGAVRHASTTSAASVGVEPWLSRVPGAWPEVLGFALARVAVRQWEPVVMIAEPVAGHDSAPIRSSCVSFVFAV